MNIPFCKPTLNWREKSAVCRVLDSGQISQGKVVERFEEKFAEYTGAPYAISTGSGSQAIQLALEHLDVKYQDVKVPSLTFTGSAQAIVNAGGMPVFTDVARNTMCLRGRFEEPAVVVNLMGNKAEAYGPKVVYDSAHLIERGCHRGKYQCYSFHGTKNMTTGFGGMITTRNKEATEWLRKARWHGLSKKEVREGEEHTARGCESQFIGHKFNMNNIAAAIGIEQLKKLDWMNQERKRCIDEYNAYFYQEHTGLHLYPIFVKKRDFFLDLMAAHGIQCSTHFEPLHFMPAYKNCKYGGALTVTEWIGRHIVSLPLYPTLSNKQIKYIAKKVQSSGQIIREIPV